MGQAERWKRLDKKEETEGLTKAEAIIYKQIQKEYGVISIYEPTLSSNQS